MPDSKAHARATFEKAGGILRTSEALRAGIHPRVLYQMRDAGELEQLSRGVYRLADLPPLGDPDLAMVAKRVPRGVICLTSALAFHDITTQIPHNVDIALPRTAREPHLEYPPIQIYRFSQESYEAGIEAQELDGVDVRIYNAEKTIADCFKFRNTLGLDVVLESLKLYCAKGKPQLQRVLEYARVCRVEKVVRPYLEAMM
jgi:predicted transcriptional regulator of viral defense system